MILRTWIRLARRKLSGLKYLFTTIIIITLFYTMQYRNEKNSLVYEPVDNKKTCLHPTFPLKHPTIGSSYVSAPAVLVCGKELNWIKVNNGTYSLSSHARKKHGLFTCRAREVIDGYKKPREENVLDGAPIISDFFTIECTAEDNKTYKNIHSGISYKQNILGENNIEHKEQQLNVLMLGFDSTSHLDWLRNLPKSHNYFTKQLNGIIMNDYNIVGDATLRNLGPMLTGYFHTELPEARRGFPNSSYVDMYPFI